MATNKLTDERLKEIAALPITYDDDIPEFSDSGLKAFAPAHPEYLITSNLFQKKHSSPFIETSRSFKKEK